MMKSLIALAIVAALGEAAPYQTAKIAARNFVDRVSAQSTLSLWHKGTLLTLAMFQFDKVVPVTAAVSPVTNTAGGALYYNAFNYMMYSATTLTPGSSPNFITSGPVAETTAGQPGWRPMNSSILCFDQKSIDYACLSTTEALAVPVSCTVRIILFHCLSLLGF